MVHNERVTASLDDILAEFAEFHGTESQKLDWLRARLAAFTEELAREIEAKLVIDPTFIGEHYNKALREAAALIRGKGLSADGLDG
jgi:hypothetical protein